MTKYQFITQAYESTLQKVTRTPAEWMAFMRSACRNYKCRFDEQVLIYAQRPDAVAVLEMKDLTGNSAWELLMLERRRKTLAVCPECHSKIHP